MTDKRTCEITSYGSACVYYRDKRGHHMRLNSKTLKTHQLVDRDYWRQCGVLDINKINFAASLNDPSIESVIRSLNEWGRK